MKLRRLIVLFALLAFLVISSPALAAPIFDIPIDPIIFTPPILSLDPCFAADLVTTVGAISSVGSLSGTGYYMATYKYELSFSGTPVAHVISAYKRVDFGADSQVAMDDTFILYGGGVNTTIFGRSANENNTGIIGAHGVITGGVTFTGQNVPSLKGTYRITDFGGNNRLCFFLE